MFERFKSGPAATVAGACLLILGGAIVVVHGGVVGTVVAAAGALGHVRVDAGDEEVSGSELIKRG